MVGERLAHRSRGKMRNLWSWIRGRELSHTAQDIAIFLCFLSFIAASTIAFSWPGLFYSISIVSIAVIILLDFVPTRGR